MSTRIIVLNGSPRKRGSTASMTECFEAGLSSVRDDVTFERYDLYDLDFKDCRGCLACKLSQDPDTGCRFKDGGTELINRIRVDADALVVASPIYYFDVTAPTRSVMHRLFYPGKLSHALPSAGIFTMNQPPENYEQWIKPHLDAVISFFGRHLLQPMDTVFAYQTQPWVTGRGARYVGLGSDYVEERERVHAERWESDLALAYEAGKAFVDRL